MLDTTCSRRAPSSNVGAEGRLSKGRGRDGKTTVVSEEKQAPTQRGKAFFPFIVLGIGISLSILLHFVIQDNVEGEAQLRFERQASDAKHVIEQRVRSYTDVIYGLG